MGKKFFKAKMLSKWMKLSMENNHNKHTMPLQYKKQTLRKIKSTFGVTSVHFLFSRETGVLFCKEFSKYVVSMLKESTVGSLSLQVPDSLHNVFLSELEVYYFLYLHTFFFFSYFHFNIELFKKLKFGNVKFVLFYWHWKKNIYDNELLSPP